MLVLRPKFFTKYDDTDNLKRMKDSDILAEKEKTVPSYSSSVLPKAAIGAGLGAVALGAGNGIYRGFKGYKFGKNNTPGWGAAGAGLKRGAAIGAVAGATILGGMAAKKRRQEREENEFYNDRLAYAKDQAKRREKVDWHQNMTQREGYSF